MCPSRLLFTLGLATALAGCSRGFVLTDRGPQAYYQTGYPIRDTSAELERILAAVKRTQVTGFYETFRFSLADSITAPTLRQRATYRRATERYTFDHTKTGSATIVSLAANRAVLVTNEHVTSLPDTIIVYYRDAERPGVPARRSPYVESVSIRTGARYLVVGVPDAREFRVVARDSAADLAILAIEVAADASPGATPVVPILAGDASKLVWGSFVYVLGYPRGFQMVTRGIVSEPNRSRDHDFLVDGMFNRGISGGLVVAVRGDTNALEWVGLATSASGDADYTLLPEARALEEENLQVPYEGRLYLQRMSRINYGITFTASVNAVQQLLRQAGIPIAASTPTQR